MMLADSRESLVWANLLDHIVMLEIDMMLADYRESLVWANPVYPLAIKKLFEACSIVLAN